MTEFFYMGGYGLYVWGSYGTAMIVLAGVLLLARRRHQSQLQQLRELTVLKQSEES